MRALSNVSLPHVAQKGEYNKSQAERSNESRLNQNFRIIQGTVAEMELVEQKLESRVGALEDAPVGIEIEKISDNVDWRVIEINSGDVLASERTNEITLGITTASGSLFTGTTSVTPPTGLSSISAVSVTVESANPLFVLVTDYTTSAINVQVLSTVSGSFSFRLHVFIQGKV